MKKDVKILNIQAADIYYNNVFHKESFFDRCKAKKLYKYLELCPPNLDLLHLEAERKLKFIKKGNEQYLDAFINVSFKYPLFLYNNGKQALRNKDYKKEIGTKTLREYLYSNGFNLKGKEYVRYKRSAGSARSGSCLFIRKDLEPMMRIWSKTGLSEKKDLCLKNLTSYEAYRALSLSSLIGVLDLDPSNILFVKDAEVVLKQQHVIRVFVENKDLRAEEGYSDIKNNIFDGEGLLDVSVFEKCKKADKGMMLLRNRFFKCCAFNTNLKKWFRDNNVTNVDQLYGVTFAKSIDDIVLVASESCLKYLKMVPGGFCKKNVQRWCDQIKKDSKSFGIVKTDEPTRFFDGEMVETTYQLLNSLQLKREMVEELIENNREYIDCIRDIKNRPEFIHYYLQGEDIGKIGDPVSDDSEDVDIGEMDENLFKYSNHSFKNKVCLELLNIDDRILHTDLFKDHLFNSLVDSLLLKIYRGRVLVNGTYATLFGNPLEYLNYILKDGQEKSKFDVDNPVSSFKEGEIYISFFEDGIKLIGSRAPHITMGNVLLSTNKKVPLIDEYFNLSKQIVVVDAINNNIQHRLSGCDYDSDSMLLSDNRYLVEAAEAHYEEFLVPYTDFKPLEENLDMNLVDIDDRIANNNVGGIVNISQQLNSHLWTKYEKPDSELEIPDLYRKIAILSVLSGAEIDSSKRVFEFDTNKQFELLERFAKTNYGEEPIFLRGQKWKINRIRELQAKQNRVLETSMEYLWEYLKEIKFNSHIRTETISLMSVIDCKTEGLSGADYNKVKEAIASLETISKDIKEIGGLRANEDFEIRKATFQSIIRLAYEELRKNVISIKRVKKIIKDLDEKKKDFMIFILLFIISNFGKNLGYSLKELMPADAKPVPTLAKIKQKNKATYTLFDKHYLIIQKS